MFHVKRSLVQENKTRIILDPVVLTGSTVQMICLARSSGEAAPPAAGEGQKRRDCLLPSASAAVPASSPSLLLQSSLAYAETTLPRDPISLRRSKGTITVEAFPDLRTLSYKA
jgi:hypothetical protein